MWSRKVTRQATAKERALDRDIAAAGGDSPTQVRPQGSDPQSPRPEGSKRSASKEEAAKKVHWQWEHRTGFKNYADVANDRIEHGYQRGRTHLRLKSGKTGATPMELFLTDCVQYDPTSGSTRKIRRVGPDGYFKRIRRYILGVQHFVETGAHQCTLDAYLAEYNSLKGVEAKMHQLAAGKEKANKKKSMFCETGAWGLLDPGELHPASRRESMKACCRRVVSSTWFFPLTMVAVMANTVWMGVDADYNDASVLNAADLHFQIVEHLFTVFFTTEIVLRFGAFDFFRDALVNGWFVFDSFLVILMIGESWVLSLVLFAAGPSDGDDNMGVGKLSVFRVARLLRLSRLGRMLRLLRVFPEVMMLLKGVAASMRSVFFTLMLLVVLLFIFGIVFKTQAENTPIEPMFRTVGRSMWVLLVRGTFLDSPALTFFPILEASPTLASAFLIFIFMSCYTVMNMLIGILCDVVRKVAEDEKEQAAISALQNELMDLLECFDRDEDQHIQRAEFELLMRNPDLNMILKRFGVDAIDLIALQDLFFEDRRESAEEVLGRGKQKLSFADFVEICVRLRGGNTASVTDIVDLREYMHLRLDRLDSEGTWRPKSVEDRIGSPKLYGGNSVLSRRGSKAPSTEALGAPPKADQEETHQMQVSFQREIMAAQSKLAQDLRQEVDDIRDKLSSRIGHVEDLLVRLATTIERKHV